MRSQTGRRRALFAVVAVGLVAPAVSAGHSSANVRTLRAYTGSPFGTSYIGIETLQGYDVKVTKAGLYRMLVHDLGANINFHLVGPSVNRSTGVAFRGVVTWRITLRKGVYRYYSDRQRAQMRGELRVT